MSPRVLRRRILTGLLLVAMVWIAYWRITLESRRTFQCVGHLRALSAATFYYMYRNGQQAPPSLEFLLEHPGVGLDTFVCPASGSESEQDQFVCDYGSLFGLAGRSVSLLSLDRPSRTPMIWDREAVHRDGTPYRNALFGDGSLHRVREERFQAALKKLRWRGPAAE